MALADESFEVNILPSAVMDIVAKLGMESLSDVSGIGVSPS